MNRPPPILVAEPIQEAVARACRIPATEWRGTLHLHLGGKAGETIYASGCFPALRHALPAAHIALHLHPHYLGIVPGLSLRPDVTLSYEGPFRAESTALQVQECLTRLLTEAKPSRMFWLGQDRGYPEHLHACMYRRHGWWRGLAFYRQFERTLGLPAGSWVRPSWAPLDDLPLPREQPDGPAGGHRIALVLATANEHAGALRGFRISAEEWRVLAHRVRELGLEPIATGHPDDGRPEMPGWRWFETDDVAEVLELLTRAERVLGLNSGMTWAALLLSAGRVLMVDAQRNHERIYDFSDCVEVVDPARHRQVRHTDFAQADLDWLLT